MRSFVPLVPLAVVLAGCSSFGAVRSAEVHAGPSLTAHVSVASPPGDDVAWLWVPFCSQDCNSVIVGGDVAVAYGVLPQGGLPFTLGGGVATAFDPHPYVEGYVQLDRDESPVGIGGRVGFPVGGSSWAQHQFYGRIDLPLSNGRRVLLNPALFLHTGNSPNGQNDADFLAFSQGVGYLLERETHSWIPAVTFVVGRGERTSYGSNETVTSAFVVVSTTLVWHRRR